MSTSKPGTFAQDLLSDNKSLSRKEACRGVVQGIEDKFAVFNEKTIEAVTKLESENEELRSSLDSSA